MASISILVETNPDFNKLLLAAYDFYDDEAGVYILREYISTATLNFQDKKLETIVKLFHRDKALKDTFIQKITRTETAYTYTIMLLKENKNMFGEATVVLDVSENWKRLKSLILGVKDDYDCPICDTLDNKKLSCGTCSKSICHNCILQQCEKRFHLRCPMCNICLVGMPEDRKKKFIEIMKNSNPKNRKIMAERIINVMFSLK
jgi:hypothetical protein